MNTIHGSLTVSYANVAILGSVALFAAAIWNFNDDVIFWVCNGSSFVLASVSQWLNTKHMLKRAKEKE